MLKAFPKTIEAFRDTLVGKAEGDAHVNLSVLHGFPKPSGFIESSWREALHSAAYASRHSPGVIFRTLRELFREFDTEVKSLHKYASQKLISSTAAYIFPKEVIGQLIELGDRVYLIIAGHGSLSSGKYSGVQLAPVDTSYFNQPDWTTTDTTETHDARILPFRINESGSWWTPVDDQQFEALSYMALIEKQIQTESNRVCVYEVEVDETLKALIPPTYLVQPFDQVTGAASDEYETASNNVSSLRPTNEVFGGQVQATILNDEGGSATTGTIASPPPAQTGPYPIYMVGEEGNETMRNLARVVDGLASAGVKIMFRIGIDGQV